MERIEGNYKFNVQVAGDGFIHSRTVWAKTFDEAEEKAKELIVGCKEVRMMKTTNITGFDVRKAVLNKAYELELLKISGAIDGEEAFIELLKYVENISEPVK